MTTESLNTADSLRARYATAPRVSVHSMEERIVEKHFFTVGEALAELHGPEGPMSRERMEIAKDSPLHLLTLCVLVLDNGWVMTGKSAPASAENFDAEKGRTFAYEDAIQQLWPLEGYLLRERLWQGEIDREAREALK